MNIDFQYRIRPSMTYSMLMVSGTEEDISSILIWAENNLVGSWDFEKEVFGSLHKLHLFTTEPKNHMILKLTYA